MDFETNNVNVTPEENSQSVTAAEPERVTLVNGVPYVGGVPQNEEKHENILAGVVGAFLFSLIGGVLYFVIYQLGYIAGICGLVMFILANFGYGLFSGNKNSKKGIIASAVMTLIVIVLSEMFCLSYEIFSAFKDTYQITIFDAMRSVPEFLKEKEIKADVIQDLIFALVFGGLAAFSSARNMLKGGKTSKRKAKANKD